MAEEKVETSYGTLTTYKQQKYSPASYKLHSNGNIEMRRQRVAKLYFEDELSARQIAEIEKKNIMTIYKDIEAIRTEMYHDRTWKAQQYVDKQLALLDFMEEQAMEGWFRSIGKTEKLQVRKDGSGNIIDEISTEETLVGDPRFLAHIGTVIDRRAKLLGLDAPQTLVIDTMESRLITLIKEGRVTFEMLSNDVGSQIATKFFNLAGLPVPTNNVIDGEVIDFYELESGE